MWRALPLTVTRRFLRGDGMRLEGAGAASGGGELSSCSCFTRTEASLSSSVFVRFLDGCMIGGRALLFEAIA